LATSPITSSFPEAGGSVLRGTFGSVSRLVKEKKWERPIKKRESEHLSPGHLPLQLFLNTKISKCWLHKISI
jgi:hypothetical protein